MEKGEVRVNGVKQQEERLRRMQIELGRARLVSRPWDLLQQPVNIIPPPDPDRDPDLSVGHNRDPDVCLELDSGASHDPDLHLDREVSALHDSQLVPDLDPFYSCHPDNGSLAAAAAAAAAPAGFQDQVVPAPNPFTDYAQSSVVIDYDGSDAPGDTSGDDLRAAFLNPFTLIPAECLPEDVPEGFGSNLCSPSPPQLSPICEECTSFPSVASEDGDSGWKDSGYGVSAGVDSRSSVTSPTSVLSPGSDGSDLGWKDCGYGAEPVTHSGYSSSVGTTGDGLLQEEEQVSRVGAPAVEWGTREPVGSSEAAGVAREFLDSAVSSDAGRAESVRSGGDSAGTDDFLCRWEYASPDTGSGSTCTQDRDEGMPKVKLLTPTRDSVDMEDAEPLPDEGPVVNDRSDTENHRDFLSTNTGLSDDVLAGVRDEFMMGDDHSESSTTSDNDADFTSNAVGLLVDVYGMGTDDCRDVDLCEIPEETANDLKAFALMDYSAPERAADARDSDTDEKTAVKGVLRKGVRMDMDSFEECGSSLLQSSQEQSSASASRVADETREDFFGFGPDLVPLTTANESDSRTVSDLPLLHSGQSLCNINTSPVDSGHFTTAASGERPTVGRRHDDLLIDTESANSSNTLEHKLYSGRDRNSTYENGSQYEYEHGLSISSRQPASNDNKLPSEKSQPVSIFDTIQELDYSDNKYSFRDSETSNACLVDLEPEPVSERSDRRLRSLHSLSGTDIYRSQENVVMDPELNESVILPSTGSQDQSESSLPFGESEHDLSKRGANADDAREMNENVEIKPEVFEAYATEVIKGLTNRRTYLSVKTSVSFDDGESSTQSQSSFDRNESSCRSPELTPVDACSQPQLLGNSGGTMETESAGSDVYETGRTWDDGESSGHSQSSFERNELRCSSPELTRDVTRGLLQLQGNDGVMEARGADVDVVGTRDANVGVAERRGASVEDARDDGDVTCAQLSKAAVSRTHYSEDKDSVERKPTVKDTDTDSGSVKATDLMLYDDRDLVSSALCSTPSFEEEEAEPREESRVITDRQPSRNDRNSSSSGDGEAESDSTSSDREQTCRRLSTLETEAFERNWDEMFGFKETKPERTVGDGTNSSESTSDSPGPVFVSGEAQNVGGETSDFMKETSASEDAALTCGQSPSQEEAGKVLASRKSSSNPLDFLNPFLPATSQPSTSVSRKFPTVSMFKHSQSSTEDYDSSSESRSEDSDYGRKKMYQMDSLHSVILAGQSHQERHTLGQDAHHHLHSDIAASQKHSDDDGTCTTLRDADNDLKNGRGVERTVTALDHICDEQSKPAKALPRNEEASVVEPTPTRTDHQSQKACTVSQEPHVVESESSQDSVTDKEGSAIHETYSTASTFISSAGDDGENSDYDDNNTRISRRTDLINVSVVLYDSECSTRSHSEVPDTVPTVTIVADDVDANGLLSSSTATDFTTLPQSPILTLAPHFPSTNLTAASATTTTTTTTTVSNADTTTAKNTTSMASPVSGRRVLVTSLTRHGQSNSISHLLNKWHAIETEAAAATTTISARRPGRLSGLHSTRGLSKSTPNLDGVGFALAEDFQTATFASAAASSDEDVDSTRDSPSIARAILARDTMPLIYGSTGDLRTSPSRSEGESGMVSVPQPLSASSGGDAYKMSSLDNLNIVIITSDDVASGTGPDGRASALSGRASAARSLPSSAVTSPRHYPSPGSGDAKNTVAGLPSVHSLIAKFNPHCNDLETTSDAAKFASSRKRWSSTPRLQENQPPPASSLSSSLLSSSQTSLSGKKMSAPSARYQWSPSMSSWVLSSSPERCRPASSYTLPQEEEMRQDGRTLYKAREERSFNETKQEGQPILFDDSGTASGGLKEDYGLENGNVAREQREREDFHFQEMSSVKNQFEHGPQETPKQRQQPIDIREEAACAEGGVYESEPATFQPQWDDEPEEGVYENEPEQRTDVVRESDRNIGAELPSVGTAKSIREKFASGQVEERPSGGGMKRELTPPTMVDGGVFENEPQYNPDVVHAGEEVQNEVLPEQGTARNIAARFKELEKQGAVPVPSQPKREITPDRTGKVEYVSEPRGFVEKYEPQVQAGVFESQPATRPDVVKSDELPEEILPERGSAKNIAQRFKQMSVDTGSGAPRTKREITPDTSGRVEFVSEPSGYVEKYEGHAESGVFESQPAGRDDVVKSDECPEEILPERGMAKNLAARFKQMESTSKSPPSPTKYKEFTPPRENGTTATVAAGVFENTPLVAADVVHADDQVEEVLPERGMAKNLANRFRQLSSGDSTPVKSPRAKKEFTPPPNAGVFENNPKQFVPDYNRPAESGILESQPEVRQDVVRGDEPPPFEQELPERGYTRNLVSAWKQRESESAKISPTSSGKPKEFTPPREEPRVAQQRPAPRTPKSPMAGTNMNEGSVHPTDLPGQYQPQAEPSVFESEPARLDDVVREEDTDWNAGMPRVDTTKKMLAKFRNLQAEAAAKDSPARPQPQARKEGEDRDSRESTPEKVGRSKSMRVAVQLEKCGACQKTVYAMEKIEIEKHSYHKNCFRCSHCHCILTPKTFAINKSVMFCTNHYKQLFATKGNYDEGFGHDQHKKRWKSEPNLADDGQNSTETTQH